MVWPFTPSISYQLEQIRIRQNQHSVQLGHILAAVNMIERRLDGYVDPALQRAIAKLEASTALLEYAMKKYNGSK